MTQAVAKFAAKKLLSKEMDKYKHKDVAGEYDPFYELVDNPRKPGKKKKVKKQVPAYIPPHDAEILARARRRAYMLDVCLFNFMGIRFGWSAVIGIIPAIGDVVDFLLALLLVSRMAAVDCGLSGRVHRKMVWNIIFDFVVGLIPFVGDLADGWWKCNSRNVRLLETRLDEAYKPKSQLEAEKSLRKDERPPPATVYEDFSDEEEERRNTFDDRHDHVRRPTRAYSGRRERVPDEEMGLPRNNTHKSSKKKPSRSGTKSSRR